MKEKRLIEFATAWKNGNIESVMSFFSDDCMYVASVGSESGTTFVGNKEVKKGIKEMMKYDNAVSSTIKNIHIHKNFDFWEWEYTYAEGKTVVGCDVFDFVGNLIKTKNAFRKVNVTIKK